jgi:uncharacterized protein YegL
LASLRIEVSLISFGGVVNIAQDFVTIDRFTPPQLVASGQTPMGEAITRAIDLLEDRKATYRSNGIQYYRPWLFMITDGAPTDSWQEPARRLREAEDSRKLSFFAVAVQGANLKTLKQIAPATRPPVVLKGLEFKEMFIWLSQSMSRVSSNKVDGGMQDLPPIGWAQAPL